MIDCLYLVKHGVPFDVAFSLPDDERLAFVVAIGTLNGGFFDWQTRALGGVALISVNGLREFADRLARLNLESARYRALECAAQKLEAAVRETISNSPEVGHIEPWRGSDELHDSVEHTASASEAVIGSGSMVAVDQEFGTRAEQPHSFLRSTAEAKAEETVSLIAEYRSPAWWEIEVIDAYAIGITLALNDGVSAGIASIRRELGMLDLAISGSAAGLRTLHRLGQQLAVPDRGCGVRCLKAPIRFGYARRRTVEQAGALEQGSKPTGGFQVERQVIGHGAIPVSSAGEHPGGSFAPALTPAAGDPVEVPAAAAVDRVPVAPIAGKGTR